jgi:hypothetical protein
MYAGYSGYLMTRSIRHYSTLTAQPDSFITIRQPSFWWRTSLIAITRFLTKGSTVCLSDLDVIALMPVM